MGGPIEEHGGEVLRFIGDAVLAIFPIEEAPTQDRMTQLNQELVAEGKAAQGYGIGLHLGTVTYGNIGTESRLEFTVIGAAANEAARVESLCKTLGHSVLMSGVFANACPEPLTSVGHHALAGVAEEMEVFTLPSDSHQGF